ncbi:hypothetical protein [Streptomyces sp. NBC_01451]|uniref:hypothetical protein n=1 Tax=Streptomyces sp. NBC_01451 TaxID=2903872 RepID=UPI002E2FAD40|nr:hypothetical protein [Streptomyces sp. NBC_01451]
MKIGDMVRVVKEMDGRQEFMYGRITDFYKPDGRQYRRKVAKPFGAYVDLIEGYSGARRPLAEVTPVAEDFEFITDPSEVHRGAFGPAGMLWCMGCPRPYPNPASVKVLHKATGVKTQLCDTHNDEEQWAQLGHQPLWDARGSRDVIEDLARNPEKLVGPVEDWESHRLREWAGIFPYLVPQKAGELYAAWKENQSAAVAA